MHATVDVDQRVHDSRKDEQDPPVIKVVSEKAAEETDDAETGEKDASAKVARKEKGEEKDDQAPMTMARDTAAEKGKQIATDSDDFSQRPIDLSSLSPIQALKLVTLTQAKASEDLLKSHIVDKELITLARDVLEKILSSFKPDTSDNPSSKLKSMLNVIESHFVSLEKAMDTRVLNQFNSMRPKTFF